MKFIVVIPARLFSSRFPGKVLAYIHGKPMIVRVIEKALKTEAYKIIVATDSNMIIQAIQYEFSNFKNNKIAVFLTKNTYRSGTERLSEVVKYYKLKHDQCIVQLQADEPLISANMIHTVVESLYSSSNNVSVTTLAIPITSTEEYQDHNIVKVVTNINNDALYFSRSKIPWNKNYNNTDFIKNFLLRHIGIYAYRANFIHRYIQWQQSPLEKLENLEQLRVLWYGEVIRVSIIKEEYSISVDTPKSLKRVNELFSI